MIWRSTNATMLVRQGWMDAIYIQWKIVTNLKPKSNFSVAVGCSKGNFRSLRWPSNSAVDKLKSWKYFSTSSLESARQGHGQPILPTVTLFTKEDCSLCDDAKLILDKHRNKFLLQVVDIEYPGNEHWHDEYRYDIPVLHINGKFSMKHRLFENVLLDSVENAKIHSDRLFQRQLQMSENVKPERRILQEEVMNFFTKSPLDKMAPTRKDTEFMFSAYRKENARFLLFSQLNPLTYTKEMSKRYSLLPLTFKELFGYLGPDFDKEMEIVFLGRSSSDGNCYFAFNIRSLKKADNLLAILQASYDRVNFSKAFNKLMQLKDEDASMACQARCILAWHESHQYCAACGSDMCFSEAGYKRVCANHDCQTNKRLSNISYPRVDPVVMSSIISPDRKAVLLGRKRTFPPGMYSCLTGFVEPGECIEDAAKREIFEESGLTVQRIMYHSSQPWPFPSSLMIGCVSETVNSELTMDIVELEDLKWFNKTEVFDMMDPKAYKLGKPFIPPRQSIANELIRYSTSLLD